MSEYVDAICEIMQPVWFKGVAILPSNGKYLVFGVPYDSLLLARLTIENAYNAIDTSIWSGEDE